MLIALSACTVEQPYKSGMESLNFTTSIEERVEDGAVSPETKTYLEEIRSDLYQVHWNEGDAITIFFDTFNGKYLFAGGDGSTAGGFNPASTESGSPFTTGLEIDRYYAVYPYAESTSLSGGVISFEFPATQTYAEDSFGLGAGVMAAATSGPSDTHLSFKNVMGFLRFKVYGGAKVQSIVLTGKNGEKLSGPAHITAVYGETPVVEMTGDAAGVTLACGGVQTGATAEEATDFYIAIPPTDFTKGFTVEITDVDGRVMTQSTDKDIDVLRSHVKPMKAFQFEGTAPEPPEPEIPDLPVVENGMPVLYVYTPGFTPGEATTNSLTNTEFIDKVNWITGSHAYLKAADGTVTDLGTANIRGRGNTTWKYKKKPYAFKLDKKASLLGMPEDKRWDLLANYLDRTRMRNDLAFELGRRLVANGVIENWWTPKGEFVELVINDVFLGNYYLCEHIKISKNRVNIKEMKATDNEGLAVTGGYLLELGVEMDADTGDDYTKWKHQFWSNGYSSTVRPNGTAYQRSSKGQWGDRYHLPVMIKDPDEDVLTDQQFAWIRDYINSVEANINHKNNEDPWYNYVDMDSFICWMFIQEVVGNYEPFHPKSAYMYKDRDKDGELGKLKMGPLWDFDYGTFKTGYGQTPVYHRAIWYPLMLKDSVFKNRVKELWPDIKATLREVQAEYAEKYTQANATPEVMTLMVSIDKDWARWKNLGGQPSVNGDEEKGIWVAFKAMTDNLNARINQMNGENDLFN